MVINFHLPELQHDKIWRLNLYNLLKVGHLISFEVSVFLGSGTTFLLHFTMSL